jgi:tetratricopeptide (TPR) repeat protein
MYKYYQLLFLTLLSVIVYAQPDNDKKMIRDLMGTAAMDFLKDKPKAILSLNKVLEIDSNYSEAYYMRGQCFYGLDLPYDALNDFAMVIRLQPDNAKPYALRGVIYTDMKNYEAALREYNSAIILDSLNSRYFFSRGYSQLNLKNDWYAIKDFEKALTLGFRDKEVYYNMAVAQENMGDFFSAYNSIENARSLGKNDQDFYAHAGYIEMMVKKFDDAIKDFNIVLTLDSTYSPALFHIGYIHYYKEDYRKSVTYISKALKYFPNLPEGYNIRGLAYHNLRQSDSAMADFTAATLLNADFPDPYFNRSEIWEEKKNYAKAIEELDRFILADPENGTGYYARGRMKLFKTDETGACTDFRKAATLGNEQAKKAVEDVCKALEVPEK